MYSAETVQSNLLTQGSLKGKSIDLLAKPGRGCLPGGEGNREGRHLWGVGRGSARAKAV